MTKKSQLIKKIKVFENKYFNADQKTIAIDILEKCPEAQVQAYADFIFMKRRTGFAFDYAPEIAKGRIITLREDKTRRINVSNSITEDENKLIIGDNYNALKALLVTHKNKIDIIYIDPPYNTEAAKTDGNHSSKDVIAGGGHYAKFQYKDKFGRGGWLNMMKARLELAKDLLTPEGVIFVSIDDTEQAYLKVLMDHIFGEDKFVANIIWQSSFGGKNDTKLIPINTEYILVYSAAKNFAKNTLKKHNFFSKEDDNFALYGKYQLTPLCWSSLTWQPSLDYIIYINKNPNTSTYQIGFTSTAYTVGQIVAGSSQKTFGEKLEIRTKRFQQNSDIKIKDWCFYWSQAALQAAWDAGFVDLKFNSTKQEWEINQKIYQKAKFNAKQKKVENYDSSKMLLRNLITDPQISSKVGNHQLQSIMMQKVFDYPKPVQLIKKLLTTKSNKNLQVLDFFAGSGTTGQAVLELNREDGGKRNFILVTNDENNIAYDVAFERIYRIIKGKTFNPKNSAKIEWLTKNKSFSDTKLRVIKIDDSVQIALRDDVSEKVYQDCKRGLQLLNDKYDRKELNLYYDLAALNPLKNEEDQF